LGEDEATVLDLEVGPDRVRHLVDDRVADRWCLYVVDDQTSVEDAVALVGDEELEGVYSRLGDRQAEAPER